MLMQSQVDVAILPCPVAVEPHPCLSKELLDTVLGYLKVQTVSWRAHLKVVEGKAHPERALKCAIDTWNKAVMEDEEYDD